MVDDRDASPDLGTDRLSGELGCGEEKTSSGRLALDGPGCKANQARVDWRPCRPASGRLRLLKESLRRSTLAGNCRWMNLYASPTPPAQRQRHCLPSTCIYSARSYDHSVSRIAFRGSSRQPAHLLGSVEKHCHRANSTFRTLKCPALLSSTDSGFQSALSSFNHFGAEPTLYTYSVITTSHPAGILSL